MTESAPPNDVNETRDELDRWLGHLDEGLVALKHQIEKVQEIIDATKPSQP
jgi:hypothetical protein